MVNDYLDSSSYFQRVWESWSNAKLFPKLVARCDYTLDFELGRDDFGFSYGNFDRRYTGPKLNLTGAVVKLKATRLSQKPSLLVEARGVEWNLSSALFTVTGNISEPLNGKVSFVLSSNDTDGVGRFLCEIEVKDSSGKIIVPGQFRLILLEKYL